MLEQDLIFYYLRIIRRIPTLQFIDKLLNLLFKVFFLYLLDIVEVFGAELLSSESLQYSKNVLLIFLLQPLLALKLVLQDFLVSQEAPKDALVGVLDAGAGHPLFFVYSSDLHEDIVVAFGLKDLSFDYRVCR